MNEYDSLKKKNLTNRGQFVDLSRFYIASDNELMIDILKGEINFLKSAWQNLLGRPLVTLVIKPVHLGRCFFFKCVYFPVNFFHSE